MDQINFHELKFKVILEKVRPFWWRFAYLIPDVLRRHHEFQNDFVYTVQGKDDKFNKFITQHVKAYIQEGVMPPDNIAAPIINISEDILAGREPEIRGGDYIALQNQMRRN